VAHTLILDSDIGTDVDDALALALAVRHPEIELRAVTTVAGDTRRRARIAAKLLRLAGREDIEVAAGERGNERAEHPSEAGHEDAMLGEHPGDLRLSDRDAVSLLLDETASSEIDVCTVGMQSNIAAALERGPSFAAAVSRLTVMGGAFAPVRFLDHPLPSFVDHNLNVDREASLAALGAPFEDVVYVPCDVTFGAWMREAHVQHLRDGDAFCRELARQVDIWRVRLERMGRSAVPDEYACLLHDPLAVATTVDRRFVTTERLPVTVAMHRGSVRTFIDPSEGRDATVVRSVDADAFADWFVDMIAGG
jgi:purine nucleosidase